jgi:hypothetical protein
MIVTKSVSGFCWVFMFAGPLNAEKCVCFFLIYMLLAQCLNGWTDFICILYLSVYPYELPSSRNGGPSDEIQ